VDAKQAALRRHAAPLLEPVPGTPLIKVTANLGRVLSWRKGRSTVAKGLPEERKKQLVKRDADIFIEWMRKEDGAVFKGSLKLHGPFPHFSPKPNDTQHGERGAKREVARSIVEDTAESEMEDYVIEALFSVPESISEIPTDLATELFTRPGGRPGLRPLREREWRGVAN
jgi:hypothetical protein